MAEPEELDYVEFPAAGLEAALAKVERFGGRIEKPIPAFPGGRRFHSRGPGGDGFAVWSERQAWRGGEITIATTRGKPGLCKTHNRR